MSKAPAMPMYWDAYLADTTHLTTEEHGAYILLLAAMWRRNAWVPDDDKDNARILGLTPAKWRKIKARLMETVSGFRVEDGKITQEKLQKTWEKTQEKIAKNRSNGAMGGRPKSRKNKDLTKANGSVSVNPNKSIPEPEPEPDIREDTNVSLSVRTDATRQAVARYNQAAERAGWPQVQKLTQNRSKQLRARLKDCGGLEGWEAALRRAFASDFCRGRTSKPWAGFGFDWLIKAANFTKLMEGNYDNRSDNRIASNGPENGSDPARDQILRLTGFTETPGDGGSGTRSHGEEDGSVWLGAGSWDSGTRQADEGLDFGAPRLSVVGGTGRMSGMG